MKHKLIIAGTRDFNDYQLLHDTLLPFLPYIEEVVSGTCSGADMLGERFAVQHKIPYTRFPANWNAYGKSAGPRRNRQMAIYATACIVFWDGKSRGTASMIALAKQHGLKLKIIKY